jgi:hypothetical protein
MFGRGTPRFVAFDTFDVLMAVSDIDRSLSSIAQDL